MAEKFVAKAAGVTLGTTKAVWNLFNPAATPTFRIRIFHVVIGSADTPNDYSALWSMLRSTGLGTEDAGFTPVNLDPGGPAGTADLGAGFSGGQPTLTANKELFEEAINLRNSFQFIPRPGCEPMTTATQNNGAALETKSASTAHTGGSTVYFME